MNKSLCNVIPGIICIAWAIALQGADACSSINNALESHRASTVDLSPTCFQSVDGNYSSLHSYGSNGYCGGSIRPNALFGGEIEVEEPGPTVDSPLYEVRASPRKGLGAFATRVIPRGTQIILEKPLVSVSMPEMVAGRGFKIQDMLSDLEMQFQALFPEQQAEYLALHDFRFPSEDSQSHLLTIFRSNAYTGDKSIGLFPRMARINHSCRPNSGNWWSEKQGHRVIYAAEDIAKGDEITVSYIPLLKKTEDRQTRLHQYGFTCDCSACHLASAESDRRRTRIANSLESLEQKVHSPSKTSATNEKSIAKALTLVKMVEEEGLNDYLSKAYMMAAVFNQRGGNVETAEMWARKELEVMTWAEEGSADVQKTLELIQSLAAG